MKLKIACAFLVMLLLVEAGTLAVLASHPAIQRMDEFPHVENDRPLLTAKQQEELDAYGRVGIDVGGNQILIITKGDEGE